MLGFLHNERVVNEAFSARFVRTSASCPPLDTQRGWLALDARGGRVLLHHRADEHAGRVLFDRDDAVSVGIRIAVWDPLSLPAAAAATWSCPSPSCRGARSAGTPRCSAVTRTASRTTPAGPSASYWWARTTRGPSLAYTPR
ncbi:uncharacterized protein [Miscanthus floridulus]|uniref:uncharacterized protein n=1 Tax=Miscanthus floridulus TaxID=154761 RepID=UPI003459746F